ncbi:globin-like protein [Rhizobium phaseoli]|uniref:Globin-like protein n=1 Tax=Rhizobium phaseoli TaxID=396 RepID=A0ABN4QQX6_9HYPH|nr:globin-like protein [Rhizobium phaseoli]MDH6646453.1 hemoglobin [Rhizobium esperanzae]ANL54498.1 globin-like protein [Rhizobium phaseoli]ANL60775.1 globin-like protein [Rhizobium phaseoli]ANL66933.1 globin-like protein [Rhizobium phaseoli]
MTVAIAFRPVHEGSGDGNDIGDGFVTENTTLYEAIGGDPAVRALTHRFYVLMDTLPEASNVRAVHPSSLEGSEEKFYEYMSGYLGGPPLYTDKRGHPRLRSRHFVAEIGPVERDEWLLCFRRALDETIASQALRDLIWAPVERLAYHMQNKAPDTEEQP